MNHSYLIAPAQLNQAYETYGSTGGGGLTRRSFIKRSGGATVATLVAWNLATHRANAGSTEEAAASVWEWKLICTLDPSKATSDTHGNDNGDPQRTWWERDNITGADNGFWGMQIDSSDDDQVLLEVRGTGPIKESKNADGSWKVERPKVSFDVSGTVSAWMNNDANDGSDKWNISDDDVIGSDSADLGTATLSIDDDGKVSFQPSPIILEDLQDTLDFDFWDDNDATDYQILGAGTIIPQMSVLGGVAFTEKDNKKWEIGVSTSAGMNPGQGGGPSASVTASSKLTWKDLPEKVTANLQWNFHRVKRYKKPDGNWSDWIDKGLASPDHDVAPPANLGYGVNP